MLTLNGSSKSLVDIVVETVIKEILTEQICPGDKVTSVREQAKVLKVNPQTVQKAYNLFIAEEILIPKQGSGNYLTTDKQLLDEIRSQFIDRKIAEFISLIDDYNIDRDYAISKIKENYE